MSRPFAKHPRWFVLLAAVASLVAAGGLLVFQAATAPLPGTISAAASVKADLDQRTVHHEQGGIVRGILVRDGDLVRAGQPLVVIGAVPDDDEAEPLLDQLQAERIRSTRAATEAALDDTFDLPADVSRSTAAAEHLAHESALFAARRRTLDEQVALLDAGIRETQARAAALSTRIAEARAHYQQLAAEDAKDAAARIRELEERLRSLRDPAGRHEVRAPIEGRVMGLRVSSVGEVVGPGAPLLEVAPSRKRLLVEARISQQDIAHVAVGAPAEVRLTAGDAQTTPPLAGRVVLVSADRIASPGSVAAWHLVNVEIDSSDLARHPDIVLQPGMAAELVIAAPRRTYFRSLAAPFSSFASKAMREP